MQGPEPVPPDMAILGYPDNWAEKKKLPEDTLKGQMFTWAGEWVEVFVKYPPRHWFPVRRDDLAKMPNMLTTKPDVRLDVYYSLQGFANEFHFTKEPILALKAISLAHAADMYPPLWALNFIVKAFDEYLDSKGTANLEKCLGLIGKRGSSNYFKKIEQRSRDFSLCQDVHLLNKGLKVSIDDAVHIVAASMNKSQKLSEQTIRDRYTKDADWKGYRKNWEKSQFAQKTLESLEERQKFITRFQYHTLPPRIRAYHPDHPART